VSTAKVVRQAGGQTGSPRPVASGLILEPLWLRIIAAATTAAVVALLTSAALASVAAVAGALVDDALDSSVVAEPVQVVVLDTVPEPLIAPTSTVELPTLVVGHDLGWAATIGVDSPLPVVGIGLLVAALVFGAVGSVGRRVQS